MDCMPLGHAVKQPSRSQLPELVSPWPIFKITSDMAASSALYVQISSEDLVSIFPISEVLWKTCSEDTLQFSVTMKELSSASKTQTIRPSTKIILKFMTDFPFCLNHWPFLANFSVWIKNSSVLILITLIRYTFLYMSKRRFVSVYWYIPS